MGARLGIFFHRAHTSAAFFPSKRFLGRRKPVERTVQAAGDLWKGGEGHFAALFRELARSLPQEARYPDCVTHIAIPDPVVIEETLSFKDFPGKRTEALDLIAWRYARDHQVDTDAMVFSYQKLSSQDGDTKVIARAAPRKLVTAIDDAAGDAGFFISRLEGFSAFWPKGAEDDAQAWHGGDWWTLSCRSQDNPEGQIHADWSEDISTDASKMGRLATAYALRHKLPSITVALGISSREAPQLREALARFERVKVGEGDAALPRHGDEAQELVGP